MTLRSKLFRLVRGDSTDVPVRLRFDAPTVTDDAQNALHLRPVMILGERWTLPKPVRSHSITVTSGTVHATSTLQFILSGGAGMSFGRVEEDPPRAPPPIPLDWDDLPA